MEIKEKKVEDMAKKTLKRYKKVKAYIQSHVLGLFGMLNVNE